jgi:hypothetical protein
VVNSLITLYCVRYDPYYCTCDSERLWEIVQRSGGSVSAGPVGILYFYVPERIISQIALMDSGLRIDYDRSLI